MSNNEIKEQQNNMNNEKRRPLRQQNRRVAVAMWLETLPDGETVRVIQSFDAPLPFEVHLELLHALNEYRTEVWKEKGKFFETRKTEIPDDPNLVIRIPIFNARTGQLLNQKALTGPEARTYMAKRRAEIESFRNKQREERENTKPTQQPQQQQQQSREFGTNLGTAIKSARQNKAASA